MPASEPVIRSLDAHITTFSVPFKRGGISVGGRTTAIRLSDGRVFLCASTPLDAATKAKIEELSAGKGPSHIAALDNVHTLYTKSYADAYPNARVIGTEPLLKKHPDIKWAAAFGRDADPIADVPDLKARYFKGFVNQDVAFFHPESKTLVQADLLFNLPAKEQHGDGATGGLLGRFSQYMNPFGALHRKLLWSGMSKDRSDMIASAKAVDAWNFTRIVPCHGDVLEGNGKEAWRSAYRDFLAA